MIEAHAVTERYGETTPVEGPTARTPTDPPPRDRLSPREDLVTAFLSFWLIVGLFIDGWSHGRLTKPEGFFTPWHAVFYAGFTACAVWIGWQTLKRAQAGRTGLAAIPVGYGLGVIGLMVFAVGGAGDMIWHLIFGIEDGLDALLSPTHLMLMIGMALIVTSPLRAAFSAPRREERTSLRAFLPPLLSLALATALASFFLNYLSPFSLTDMTAATTADLPLGVGLDQPLLENGVAGVLITNLILLAPILLLLRRLSLPFGAVTVLFGLVAVLILALDGFALGVLVVPALLGGLAADVLIARTRPSFDRPASMRVFAVVVPLVLWGSYYLVLELVWGLTWVPELWSGAIVFACLTGLLLVQLMLPTERAATAPRAASDAQGQGALA